MGRPLIASGDVEGLIKLWDPMTGRPTATLSRHEAGVQALAVLPETSMFASADVDGCIRIWDAVSSREVNLLPGHSCAVYALAAVPGVGLASADVEGVIRLWDPLTGDKRGELSGGSDMIWSLAVVDRPDGTRLISAGVDGRIRVWDPLTGTELDSSRAMDSVIYCVSPLPGPDGRQWLAAAGVSGEIAVWDLDERRVVRELHGHTGAVRDLLAVDGRLLVSAGGDAAVRLWDPRTGDALAQGENHWGSVLSLGVLSGALPLAGAEAEGALPRPTIRTAGFGDSAAGADLLDRGVYVDVVAALFAQSCGAEADEGPSVVAIEGPWGAGKTTLMGLIKARLDELHHTRMAARAGAREQAGRVPRRIVRRVVGARPLRGFHLRLTVAWADWGLALGRLPLSHSGFGRADGPAPVVPVTAWLNAWAYQNVEQVWAGLAQEIINSCRKALFPAPHQAERYWFGQNIRRIDRRCLRRQLWLRIVSPLLRTNALLLLVPSIAALLIREYDKNRGIGSGALLAVMLLPAAVLVVGLLHTLARYLLGNASSYLHAQLFRGPILSWTVDADTADPPSGGPIPAPAPAEYPRADPMYNSKSGYLYLLQHDIRDLMTELAEAGLELVMFIDDLDRCSPPIAGEIFEAINLFLSESFPRARFVIALDPMVIAASVDRLYPPVEPADHAERGDDPSTGWTFLRKLIQLPVVVPRIRDTGLDRLLDAKLGPEAGTEEAPGPATGEAPPPEPPAPERPSAGDERSRTAPQPSAPARQDAPPPPPAGTQARLIEQLPEVRATIRSRMRASHNPTARDIKRLLSVWQFYLRVCERVRPVPDEECVHRACRLVIVAEIITRWPAYLRLLSRITERQSAAQRLAAGAAGGDAAWREALAETGLAVMPPPSQAALRELLSSPGAVEAADLFTMVT